MQTTDTTVQILVWQSPELSQWTTLTLQWRYDGRDSVSTHQPHDCLLNRLFRRRSKKTSKLRVTGFCVGNSPHKGPVTRKLFPLDDVIMSKVISIYNWWLAIKIPNECYSYQCYIYHYGFTKWKCLPRYQPFVWGIHRSPVDFPQKASDAELWCFSYLCLNKRLGKQSRRR